MPPRPPPGRAIRRPFTHNDGTVDQKYLAKAPGSPARIGHRLIVTEADCRRVIADATCQALADLAAQATGPRDRSSSATASRPACWWL